MVCCACHVLYVHTGTRIRIGDQEHILQRYVKYRVLTIAEKVTEAGAKLEAAEGNNQDSAPATGIIEKPNNKANASEQVETPASEPAGAKAEEAKDNKQDSAFVTVPISYNSNWGYVHFDLNEAKRLQKCRDQKYMFVQRFVSYSFIPSQASRVVHENIPGK